MDSQGCKVNSAVQLWVYLVSACGEARTAVYLCWMTQLQRSPAHWKCLCVGMIKKCWMNSLFTDYFIKECSLSLIVS